MGKSEQKPAKGRQKSSIQLRINFYNSFFFIPHDSLHDAYYCVSAEFISLLDPQILMLSVYDCGHHGRKGL